MEESYDETSRLMVYRSSFLHPKSSHLTIIRNHPFNHQVELFVPNNFGQKSKKKKEIKIPIKRQPKNESQNERDSKNEIPQKSHSNPFGGSQKYYELTSSDLFSSILSKEFIEKFIRPGLVVGVSRGGIADCGPVIGITSQGILIFSLDHNTYQQFGLQQTKKHPFSSHKNKFYYIEINILEDSFEEGKKNYERVKWCLTSRFPQIQLLLSSTEEITFQDTQKNKLESLPINSSAHHYISMRVPQLSRFFSPIPSLPSHDDQLEELLTWVGLVANRCFDQVYDQRREYICNYQTNLEMEKSSGSSFVWEGLISSTFIENCLNSLRTLLLSQNEFTWGYLRVNGVEDSPISWNNSCHSYSINGDNNYTFIVYRNPNSSDIDYLLFYQLGSKDKFLC